MREVIMKVEGIAFSTNEFEVRGIKWKFTEEELKQIVPKMIGKPFTAGHRGPRIGILDEAWFEDGKIKFRASIYKPRNDVERKHIEKIKNGEVSGVSPGFTFPIKRPEFQRGILHGRTEIIEKTENGTGLKVRFVIPKEEIIEKFGSIENLKELDFSRIWLHDGSNEAKRQVEEKYRTNKEDKKG